MNGGILDELGCGEVDGSLRWGLVGLERDGNASRMVKPGKYERLDL